MDTRAKPSINSTEPKLPPPIQLRPLETESREAVAQMVEGFLGTNWRISHHLNAQKDAQLMSSVPIYVWQRQGRNRAGLLILQAGQPAIYWNQAQDQPFTLKLQVPATFTHNGPWILVATLSKTERLLTLEDTWVADGKALLASRRYSERWQQTQQAFAALKDQQYFLGCELRLVEPISFSKFLTVCDEAPAFVANSAEQNERQQGTVWEFQPDVPLRRRLVWQIPGSGPRQSNAPPLKRSVVREDIGASFIPLVRCTGSAPKHTAKTKYTTQPQPRIHVQQIPQLRVARITRDPPMPDSYLLESADGTIGRPCVSRLAQSMELRREVASDSRIVEITWNSRFKKYEVVRFLPADTALSTMDTFGEMREMQDAP
jgi:hypothetical protein